MNLKARFTEPTIVLAPGVYDALSALAAEQAGFEAPCRITERLNLPVIVDADTGFGNAVNVQRTVRGLERAGAAMIQLEDQSFPKRCGHLEGKTVVPTREMCGKLRAALDSRVGDALILALTDALAIEGIDVTMDRAQAYLECGVDALFIEALRTSEQMQQACALFSAHIPLLANMVEGGKTPIQSLQANGTTAPMRESMLDFDQLNAVIGTPALLSAAKAYE